MRKVERGDVNHRLGTHVEAGKVGVSNGVNGVRYDAINVGGADTEGSDAREHVTSSHEVLGKEYPGKGLPDMLRDGAPTLALRGDDRRRGIRWLRIRS